MVPPLRVRQRHASQQDATTAKKASSRKSELKLKQQNKLRKEALILMLGWTFDDGMSLPLLRSRIASVITALDIDLSHRGDCTLDPYAPLGPALTFPSTLPTPPSSTRPFRPFTFASSPPVSSPTGNVAFRFPAAAVPARAYSPERPSPMASTVPVLGTQPAGSESLRLIAATTAPSVSTATVTTTYTNEKKQQQPGKEDVADLLLLLSGGGPCQTGAKRKIGAIQ